jgi:transcriptional regulator with XRE-family HTH domain
MKLGKVIRKYRVTNELTLREVSKEIGIGAATLMRLERGHEPDGSTLAKIIAWLCVDEGKNGSKSKGERQ